MKELELIVFSLLTIDCFFIGYMFYKSRNGLLRVLLIEKNVALALVNLTNIVLILYYPSYYKYAAWLMIPFIFKAYVMTRLTVYLYKNYRN